MLRISHYVITKTLWHHINLNPVTLLSPILLLSPLHLHNFTRSSANRWTIEVTLGAHTRTNTHKHARAAALTPADRFIDSLLVILNETNLIIRCREVCTWCFICSESTSKLLLSCFVVLIYTTKTHLDFFFFSFFGKLCVKKSAWLPFVCCLFLSHFGLGKILSCHFSFSLQHTLQKKTLPHRFLSWFFSPLSKKKGKISVKWNVKHRARASSVWRRLSFNDSVLRMILILPLISAVIRKPKNQ